jgi:hypothetical protein
VFSQHQGYVSSVAFHPDGMGLSALLREGLVISGGHDKIIYAHHPEDKEASHVLIGHEANVHPP